MKGSWISMAALLAVSSPSSSQDLTLTRYREILHAYRIGTRADGATTLETFSHVLIAARNEQLRKVLDVTGEGERREIGAAAVLMAELALASPAEARDFFLDESILLAAALGEGPGVELQKRVHVAVALSLLREQRIADAFHVLEPAAREFPWDFEIQYTYATVSELRGLVESSDRLLERAQHAYTRMVSRYPNRARARARLGHVLLRLGRVDAARRQLSLALERLEDRVHRVIAWMSLGKVHAQLGEPSLAMEAYREAVALDPACQAAIVSLARALDRSGLSREARDAYLVDSLAPAASSAAADSWMLYRLADGPLARQRFEELAQWYR